MKPVFAKWGPRRGADGCYYPAWYVMFLRDGHYVVYRRAGPLYLSRTLEAAYRQYLRANDYDAQYLRVSELTCPLK